MHASPTQSCAHRGAQRWPDSGYRVSPSPGAVTLASVSGALQVPLSQSGLGKKLARARGKLSRIVSARRDARLREWSTKGAEQRWPRRSLSRSGWGCSTAYESSRSRHRQPRPRRPAAPPPAFNPLPQPPYPCRLLLSPGPPDSEFWTPGASSGLSD